MQEMSEEEAAIYRNDGCRDCNYGHLRDTAVCPGCGATQKPYAEETGDNE